MKHFALRLLPVFLSVLLLPGCKTVENNREARRLLLDCDYRIEDLDLRSVTFGILSEKDLGGRCPDEMIAKLRILGGEHHIFLDELVFDVTTTVRDFAWNG